MSALLPASHRRAVRSWAIGGGAAAAVILAACGSSSPSTASSGGSGSPAKSSTPTLTISSANVPGYGTVLVDSHGRTLYMLTSEQGGKVTCTDANGCTKFWPDVELPPGATHATAGSGVTASMLGTVKGPDGGLYVTYNNWPLYTFARDSAAGQANGEGINSFGGTWYVLGTNGSPVTSKAAGAGSTTTTSSGGYGY